MDSMSSYTHHLSSSCLFNPTKSTTFNFHSQTISNKFPILYSSNSNNSHTQHSLTPRDKTLPHLVLIEKYSNGTAKRYILDGKTKQTFVEQSLADKLHGPDSNNNLTWLPGVIKDFILPAGYPESVSDDYLEYMLWQLPTNITGWMCHVLVTSSLLKAVGVGSFSGSAVAASAAAIRWVSKDGIGAVGRLIIGGRFGSLFDDDPKQWRMYADFIGSAGSIFDISTQIYPGYFLPLASVGNLAKAVARGLKDPSFRVIQNHFALLGNLGDVAAKEEVWEVTAQLMGLALGILILETPGLVASYPSVLSTWMGLRLFHLWLRYQSLSVLKFKTINLKRARILSREHVLQSKVFGYIDCNVKENILLWQRFLKPRIIFGVPLDELIGGEKSFSMVKKIFEFYIHEKYVLTVMHWHRNDFDILVSFKVGATSLSVLRSVWQAYWLYEHWESSDDVIVALEESLVNLEAKFDDFMAQLEAAGWDTHKINLNVPREPCIEEVDYMS